MKNGLSASKYIEPLSLVHINRMHLFLSLTSTCVQCGSDGCLKPLDSKFNNQIKICFFSF